MFWNPITRSIANKLNWVTTHVPPAPREEGEPKRRILLVHAHPRDDSFSHAIADAVESGASEGGHELRRVGLYKEKFQPALSASERGSYFDVDKGIRRAEKTVQKYLTHLRWCDSIVFVYPTWWFNMPAMLKGFFDRVLLPGDGGAWDFPAPGRLTNPLNGLAPGLSNVKRIAGISTYGAPRHIALLAGDNGRNCIGTAIRPVFHPDCTCLWLALYRLDDCSNDERTLFLKRVKEAIRDDF